MIFPLLVIFRFYIGFLWLFQDILIYVWYRLSICIDHFCFRLSIITVFRLISELRTPLRFNLDKHLRLFFYDHQKLDYFSPFMSRTRFLTIFNVLYIFVFDFLTWFGWTTIRKLGRLLFVTIIFFFVTFSHYFFAHIQKRYTSHS